MVELPRPIADALAASGVVQIGFTDRPGWWEVAASTHIGVISVGGLQVVIQPKIDINRLVFLMGYARRPDYWRDERVHLDAAADLPEALADAFVRLATRALDQGLLKGYQTVEETLPVLRGRIREADQLRRRWGRSIPLEVRYDEFTVDIAENRLLLAAVERLLRTPQVGVRHRGGLQRLRLILSDVTAPVRGGARPSWTPSRLNARYMPALELAELVLDGRSFEQRVGDLVVSGYLFNMAKVFEDFVCTALGRALVGRAGGSVKTQDPWALDAAGAVGMKPDLVWYAHSDHVSGAGHGRPTAVVDAKYKAEKPAGFPNADVYQMLAYCTRLGLPMGWLVYAKGNEAGATHEVVGAGIEVRARVLDLALPPSDLVAQVDALAVQMIARLR